MEHSHHNQLKDTDHQKHEMKGHEHHKNNNDHSVQNGHDEHNHHDHHRMMIDDFKKRFWVSLILTLPVLLLSPMIQNWLGLDWSFTGDKYVLFALSSIIYFYGGYPFLKGFFEELGKKAPGMMTLIAIAISAAYPIQFRSCFWLRRENLLLGIGDIDCSDVIGALVGNAFSFRGKQSPRSIGSFDA